MILSRFKVICEVATALNVEIGDVALKKEWLQLSRTANPNSLKNLEFYEWCKTVLSIEDPKTGVGFPQLCTSENVIRSLSNSNANAQRTFSAFLDILKKKLFYRPRPVWSLVPLANFIVLPQTTNGALPGADI